MANANPPKKNQAFQFHIGLEDMENDGRFKSSPTIAAGDFKISKDEGALANLATLPIVSPASSKVVLIALSSTEMNADNVVIIWSDQDGPEWADGLQEIITTA
jgi:hypothetical protein